MSARPLSARTSRSRAAFAAPALAVTLALTPALTPVFAPAAGAQPGIDEVLPAQPGPAQMPFDGQDSQGSRGEQRPDNELPRKAEDFGGSVINEVIDLTTGIVKCVINLATDSVPCPL